MQRLMKPRRTDFVRLNPGIGQRDRVAIRSMIAKLREARVFLKDRGITEPRAINKVPR